MKKDDLVDVGHMLDIARSITQRMESTTRADFDADEDLRLALAHRLQTIGEAARPISPAFQQSHPQIPWKRIFGMRHRVVHDYIHVDYDLVWETARLDVQPLLSELEKIVPPDPSSDDSASQPDFRSPHL